MPPKLRPTCVWLVLLVAGGASAQTYKSDPVDTSLSKKRQIAIQYAKSPQGAAEREQEFRDYIEKYHLPAMTRSSEAGLERIEKLRVDLFRQFIWPASPQNQKYVSDKTFEYAKRVVRSGGYHPAATYNALLVLGMLDDRYAGEENPTPVPSVEANKLLCAVARSTATKERLPRFFLAGALVGLERHTKYLAGLPQANQDLTTKTLVGVLTAPQLAGEYGQGVREWIYTSAARGLANLGTTGPEDRFFRAVVMRVADEKLDLDTRLELASLLGKFNPQPGVKDAAKAVDAIQKIAMEVTKEEAGYADQFEKLFGNRGGTREMQVGRGKEARRIRLSDRRYELVLSGFLSTLGKLSTAVDAVAPLADEARKPGIEQIAAALKSTIESVAKSDTIDLRRAQMIKQLAEEVAASAPAEGGAEVAADF